MVPFKTTSLTTTQSATIGATLSAQGIVYALGGNSSLWNSAYNTSTNYQSTSSNFVYQQITSFTPTVGDWYRIITGSVMMGGTIKIGGAYNNQVTDVEFQFNIAGYGQGGSIQQTRFSSFNNGNVSQVRIVNDPSVGNLIYLDINVGGSSGAYAPLYIQYTPNTGPYTGTLVTSPVSGATVSSTSAPYYYLLSLAHGFRTTNSVIGNSIQDSAGNTLNLKANIASPTFTGTVGGITKTMVGLGSVDNTTDAAKPVSTATQTALDLKANLASPTFTGTVTVPVVKQSTTLYTGTDISDDDSTRTVYFNIPSGAYNPAKYFKVARIKITGSYQNVSLNGYFTATDSSNHVGGERKVEFDFIAYAATNPSAPQVTYLKRGPDTTSVLVYAVPSGGGAGTTYYDVYIKSAWVNDTNGELAIRVGYSSAVTVWQAGLDSGTSAPVDTLVNPNSNYTFDTTGKVGIGTTTPSEKLSVFGNITLNNNNLINGFIQNTLPETYSSNNGTTLTGTVYFADASAVTGGVVTGIGTAFLSELKVGDRVQNTSNTYFGGQVGNFYVKSIQSNTQFTLSRSGGSQSTGSGSAFSAKRYRALFSVAGQNGNLSFGITNDGAFSGGGADILSLAPNSFNWGGRGVFTTGTGTGGVRGYSWESTGGWESFYTDHSLPNLYVGVPAGTNGSTAGLLTVGSASPLGSLGVYAKNASTVVASFKGAASQSQNYLNISSSSGTGDILTVLSSGNVGIGTTAPNERLTVSGNISATGTVFASAANISGDIVANRIQATVKNFYIKHPTKPDKHLVYSSLETPYNGVQLTGEGEVVNGLGVVELPDYLNNLIHPDSIHIQLTNYQHSKSLYVDRINIDQNNFTVKCDSWFSKSQKLKFFWLLNGVRKDIERLETEV